MSKKTSLIFAIITFIITTTSFFRIPVVGVFLDGMIFEFFFGFSKYIIYLFLFFYCMLRFANWKLSMYVFNKRALLIYASIIISFSMLLSSIYYFVFNLGNFNFSDYFIHSEFGYLTKWKIANLNHFFSIQPTLSFNQFAYGGILGALFIALFAKYAIIVFSILLLVLILIVLIINYLTKLKIKMREKLIKKLGGFNSTELHLINNIEISNINLLMSELLIKNKIITSPEQLVSCKYELKFRIDQQLDYNLLVLIKQSIENTKKVKLNLAMTSDWITFTIYGE